MFRSLFLALALIFGGYVQAQASTPAPSEIKPAYKVSEKPATQDDSEKLPTHGFSVFGKLKYPPEFKHFDYVNPEAPKGGQLNYGTLGSFDSLNPHIVKGNSAAMLGLTFARLLIDSYDRAGESYAYAAESVEIAPDRSSVTFQLNPKAKFNTGDLITPEDVIWSFETIRTKGHPMYRTYYTDVSKVEKVGERGVKFTITNPKNAELPLILGQIPILCKKFYTDDKGKFEETTLHPAPSSGPYEVAEVIPGRSITYKRVKDWWGENIPSQKGHHNFGTLKVIYYMDQNALFEAFKTGEVDLRPETSAKIWSTGFTFPSFKAGWVKKEDLSDQKSSRTYGIFLNTRRDSLKNINMRKALTMAFDFEWANKNLYYGLYKRNLSFFPNSDYASTGIPEGEELALLEPYRAQLPPELFTKPFTLPVHKTERDLRVNLLEAEKLLQQAGYKIESGQLINSKTKKLIEFEAIITDQTIEKMFLNFASTLKRIGVTLNIRKLDSAAYQKRVDDLEYDMVFSVIPQSGSLGNEQRDYFGSAKADMPGTRNYSGIKSPVADALIELLINSDSYKTLTTRGRALDRVLLSGYTLIPAWYRDTFWVSYWDRLARPETTPKYLPLHLETWWFDAKKDKALKDKMAAKEG
jgi:microcin C transport system substrate-binding protein